MKLSNKILLGFFGFIFIYLSVAFAEIRLRGDLTQLSGADISSEKIDLTDINYLQLGNLHKNIIVVGSDKSGIEVKSLNGDFLKHLKYQMKGDTLLLTQLDSLDREPLTVMVFVYVPANTFSGVNNNGGSVNLKSIERKLLSITQNDGWINLIDCKLERLELTATNDANFNMSKTDLDTLTAQVDNAEIRINNEVNIVNGSMTNKSYLRVKGVDEIQLKTDKSSKMDLN